MEYLIDTLDTDVPVPSTKPTIRILIYTDDPNRVREGGPFGIQELRKHIAAHLPAFADIQPTLVSRNRNALQHADRLLDRELASGDYDQVWMFGIHQANRTPYKLSFPGGGGPRSELLQTEIDDLSLRMSVGDDSRAIGMGVLIAGDHANPPPTMPLPPGPTRVCPPHVDHRTFLGLGRALGKHVLRGGELRTWEGPPTHCSEDSFNTQYLPAGGDITDPSHQSDPDPQPLRLETFDSQGNPSPSGTPHRLFKGKSGKWIRVLPDHDHEGAVTLPRSLPFNVWPRGRHFQPQPQVIAHGTNRRTGKPLNILAAYDGNPADVGRIVSDSSWHHYFNINLNHLSAGTSSEADQIGQFYSNLAVWLCPLKKRREMGVTMVHWLASHPLMLEEVGSGALNVGRLALSLLKEVASGCEIEELLIALSPESLRQSTSNFIFTRPNELGSLPSIEITLGSILHEYFAAVCRDDDLSDDQKLSAVLHRGFEGAFTLNALEVTRVGYETLYSMLSVCGSAMSFRSQVIMELLKGLEFDEPASSERRTTMATETREEWFYTLKVDGRNDEENFTLILFTDPAQCEPIGPFGLRLCRIHGRLVSGREEYRVTGTRLFTAPLDVINLEFPFRRVRLMASGVVTRDTDLLLTRFIAHDKNPAFSEGEGAFAGRIDPGTGDTGTGTGTQTLV